MKYIEFGVALKQFLPNDSHDSCPRLANRKFHNGHNLDDPDRIEDLDRERLFDSEANLVSRDPSS